MAKKSKGNRNHHPSVQRKGIPSNWLFLGSLTLIAIAILVLVWFALIPNRPSGGTPQLGVSTDRLDLGKQIFGKTVHASFQVKNTGTGTLTLSVPRSPTVLEGC